MPVCGTDALFCSLLLTFYLVPQNFMSQMRGTRSVICVGPGRCGSLLSNAPQQRNDGLDSPVIR